jgi:hypothetical protein
MSPRRGTKGGNYGSNTLENEEKFAGWVSLPVVSGKILGLDDLRVVGYLAEFYEL